jgi:hypothetical protein
MNLFRRPTAQVTMGQEIVATFSGRASPDMAMEVFGYLMQKLKLWGELKSQEDVVLHNAALQIIAEMRAGPSVNLKDLGKLTFVIEHERPEDEFDNTPRG